MSDETPTPLNSPVELFAICERFDLEFPLPPLENVDQLADLIATRHQMPDGSERQSWHQEIEEIAHGILNCTENRFSPTAVQSNTVPKRLSRMRFANLFAKTTGLRTRFQRVPHAAYVALVPFFAALFSFGVSVRLALSITASSIVIFTYIWMHFTSRDCTMSKFADLVICDNLHTKSKMTRHDVVRYLKTKLPHGF